VKANRSAFVPALTALLLPLFAFALAWAYAGKIPMAVAKAEWGTWFVMGALLGVAGIAGLALVIKAFTRSGYRSMAVAALVLNLVVVLIAWAGVFA
jgi:hypothetical protein